MTATLTKWYEEHGRHEIIAGGKKVNLPSVDHTLVLRAEDVNHAKQHDLDDKGIAKTAREEKKRERDQKLKDAEMMKLYRQHVLKEEPVEGLVPLSAILPAAPINKPAPAKAEAAEVGSFGD
jgi:hypothetical protein